MRVVLDPPKGPKGTVTLRYAGLVTSSRAQTRVYFVDGDPQRWMHVTQAIFGIGAMSIENWGQPHRLWDGAGAEYRRKGLLRPPTRSCCGSAVALWRLRAS